MSGFSIKDLQKNVILALNEIDSRFNGEILRWNPVFDFEVECLESLGLIRRGVFIYNRYGEQIGEIIPEQIRKISYNPQK